MSSSLVDSADAGVTVQNRVLLVSIDGWGIRAESKGNAILNANTVNINKLANEHLHCKLDASGLSVGLPAGVMGNSEVGHLTMGAGRVEFQDLVRINKSIDDGLFAKNATIMQLIDRAKQGNGRVHLLGLCSDGAVHSHIQHLFRFLEVLKSHSVPQCYIHFFADGRDTPPTTAVKYINEINDFTRTLGYGTIATVQGRYYAMDRDKRWERIKIAFDALVAGQGDKVVKTTPEQLIPLVEQRYKEGENDEFLRPIIVDERGLIGDGDSLLFINFRSDRMREITSVLHKCTPSGDGGVIPFEPAVRRRDLMVVQMTQYDEKIVMPIVFPPQSMDNGLPEWISKHGLAQFHTAETEKYAHVTFFFAGGKEQAYALEDRQMISSPKVATYDLQPEMSQAAVGDSVIAAMETGKYPFIMCNFAAPDMVGHTGVYDKAVIACKECDNVIGKVWEACKKLNYTLVVTADHGNAEEMESADGTPKTSHTTNLIPLIIASPSSTNSIRFLDDVLKSNADTNANTPAGGLSDVAPTVLALMGLRVPKEMTGRPLVQTK